MVDKPSSREEAIAVGCKYFFTGKPCLNGHTDKRYSNTGICYACKREQSRRDYCNHKDRTKVINDRSRRKNIESARETRRKWAAANREKSNGTKSKWKRLHREQYLAEARAYSKRKRQDPVYRLNANTSKQIWDALRALKGGRHWETLVDFTLNDLVKHLQTKFKIGMTWDNYGTYWELDHVKPKSLCASFEETWNIDNLQPLECSLNRSKCNRHIG